MKRYYDLSNQEKLALKDGDFETSVRLEAVERGIKLPVALEEIINQFQFTGYSIPGDAVFFYEVCVPNEYGHSESRTGLCFRTLEEARNASRGAVIVLNTGYGADAKNKLINGEISIRETWVSLTKIKSIAGQIEELEENTEDLDKLREECLADLFVIKQAAYDKEVRARKRKSYLELAQGNVEIAKAFWSKTEGGEFPEEDAA